MRHHRSLFLVAAAVCAVGLAGCWRPAGRTPAEQRAAVLDMREETLARLYALNPDARRVVERAVGHAVFSNYGVKVLFVGGGQGYGVAVDNASRRRTYMRMAQVGAGLGAGVKEFRVVFVFTQREAFDRFVSTGLEVGGELGAAAKYGARGAAGGVAVPIAPGVKAYQLTDAGLMAEAMLMGTKYWRDDALN